MRMYLLSLSAGVLVGVVYSLLNVRSPAPPIVALVGLLGILAGEQMVPVLRHMLAGWPLTLGWFTEHRLPHICGELSTGTIPTGTGAGTGSGPGTGQGTDRSDPPAA
jgi:XapX domain-containing protein